MQFYLPPRGSPVAADRQNLHLRGGAPGKELAELGVQFGNLWKKRHQGVPREPTGRPGAGLGTTSVHFSIICALIFDPFGYLVGIVKPSKNV